MRHFNKAVLAAASLIAWTGLASAQAPRPADRAAGLKALTDCRAIGEAGARLACFDGAVARLDEAEKAGEVVVLDRSQVRTAKREAFGLRLPSFDLFDRTDTQRLEEVDNLESTIASAGQDGYGRWTVTLANGQTWKQTDSNRLNRARRGDAVTLRRGALGSFFMRVGRQPGVRAERLR